MRDSKPPRRPRDRAVETVQHAVLEAGAKNVLVLAVTLLADAAHVPWSLVRRVLQPFRCEGFATRGGRVEQKFSRCRARVAANGFLLGTIKNERQAPSRFS